MKNGILQIWLHLDHLMLPFLKNQKTPTLDKCIEESQPNNDQPSIEAPEPLVWSSIVSYFLYFILVPALANKVYEDVFPVIVRPKSGADDLEESTLFALNRLTGGKTRYIKETELTIL